jgi:hypothetical protein
MRHNNRILPNKTIEFKDKISLHFTDENLFYFIPTIAFQKLDWIKFSDKKIVSYLFVIKFLKWSVGILFKKYF